jgi:coupling of ubiquitin conjugation to ER degradation protein 1
MAQDNQTSINIPQLIAVAFVGFLAIRWLMSKPVAGGNSRASSTSSRSSTGSSSRRTNIDVNKIEQVSAVFPQLDRRTIAWDLHHNGGNVQGTMERVLSGRGLDTPPPTFQPNLPAPVEASGSTAIAAVHAHSAAKRSLAASSQTDLITRYNLQSRVNGKGKEPVLSEEAQKKQNGWSADKNARAETLKRRREEMVLAARRKLEEKDAAAA